MPTPTNATFPLGRLVATRNAISSIPFPEILVALARHATGDWGDVSPIDRTANDEALEDGNRIVSLFKSTEGIELFVITEWDRSATTVLLPEDY